MYREHLHSLPRVWAHGHQNPYSTADPADTLRGASEMSSEHLEVAGWSQSPTVYDITGEGDKVTVNNN